MTYVDIEMYEDELIKIDELLAAQNELYGEELINLDTEELNEYPF